MRSQITVLAAALVFLPVVALAQGVVDYTHPATVAVSAKCPDGRAIKDQWFSLFDKFAMEPRAAVAISAAPDMSVKSIEISYAGSRSGFVSPGVVSSVQHEVALLASSTRCIASVHVSQITDRS